ncbi:MAG: MlaD family protein [Spirochaetes bacterium]|nr:MlaD family protein [Spirochaetota bacterium]
MKFRIRYADQVVGVFIVIALVIFCGIIVLLGMNQRWFAKNYSFKTRFESGAGVSAGTAIVMKGFPVGKIAKVELDDENRVDVEFVIFDTYYPKVREYSLIELSVSPIGLGTQILFHPGKGENLIQPGEFIPEASSPDGAAIVEQELAEIPPKDDTVTRLLANVNPLLEDVNKIVVTANRTLTEVNRALAGQSTGPLGQSIVELPKTMRGVNEVVGNVNDVVVNVNGTVTDAKAQVETVVSQVSALMAQTSELMASVQAITGNLEATTEAMRDPTGLVPRLLDPQGSIKTFLDDKNAIYNKVTSMMTEIEKSVKSLSAIASSLNDEMPKIAAILNESRTALRQAQDVLQGLKTNPLISGGIPERSEQQSLYQSMRGGEY